MKISVVINTYNRCKSLRVTLDALRYQTYQDFEVVVVNGPSTDGSREMLAQWQDRAVCVDCPVVNISVSRNMGIAAANGDVVAFIDDDAIPEPDWLEKLAKPYADTQVAGVGGIVWDHTGMSLQYRFSYCDHLGRTEFTSVVPDHRAITPESKKFIYLQGTNSSFRRSALEAIGGFDEEIEYFHDETDVAARIQGLGLHLVPLPHGAVHHRYLASHLRTKERTILEPYPIVKNSYYFALINGSGRYPREEILAHLESYVAGVREHAERALRNDRMTKEQYDYFMRRVDEGSRQGLSRGSSGVRKLQTFPSAKEHRFRPFPTVAAEGERLKICFVSKEYPPENFGGIGRFTKDLAEGLVALGHQVHVVTYADEASRIDWENGVWLHRMAAPVDRISTGEVQSIPFKWNLLHCATVYEEVRRLNQRFELDIVSSPLWSSEGLFCQCDPSLPTVLTLMTSQKTIGQIDPSLGKSELWQQQIAMERQSVRRTKYIHAISQAILDKTLKDYGPTSSKCSVSYLGVCDETKTVARQRSQDDHRIRILCVGRLEPRKGTDLLLAAAQRLCRDNPHVQFVLAGKDSGSGGKSYREQFTKAAPHLVDSEQVLFAGEVTENELHQHYADADVFVLPSRFESFGLVLLEAMSFGLPLVATKVGGIEEIVNPGENGLLFEPDMLDQLVSCLSTLCTDQDLRSRMGREARRQFDDQWSIAMASRRTAKAYTAFARDFKQSEQAGQHRSLDDAATLDMIAQQVSELGRAEPLLRKITAPIIKSIFRPSRSEKLSYEVTRVWYRKPARFAEKVFKTILNREPEKSSVEYFVARMQQGAQRLDIVKEIAESPEAKSLEVPTDWFDRLPKTQSIERLQIAFPIWGMISRIPIMLRKDGPIRTELRRNRKRKAAAKKSA